MSNLSVNIVPTDSLALLGARIYSGTLMTKVGSRVHAAYMRDRQWNG